MRSSIIKNWNLNPSKTIEKPMEKILSSRIPNIQTMGISS